MAGMIEISAEAFNLTIHAVMTVTTSQRSYWRGETKMVYTGKGWADGKNQQTVPSPIGKETPDLELVPPRAEGTETIEVVQTVKIERKGKQSVLFTAGPASAVTELKSDSNSGLKWSPEEWELRWNKPARVDSYSVVSQVAVLDEKALREAAPPSEGKLLIQPYLQLPDSLPARVRELAEQQTSGLTNDYDRAKKLEQYLKETFPYTNTPDLTRRTNRANGDFVDAFLFEVQEGYCDYFSTAFVVMARSIGLPTRWVKGYSTGFDPAAIERTRFGGPSKFPTLRERVLTPYAMPMRIHGRKYISKDSAGFRSSRLPDSASRSLCRKEKRCSLAWIRPQTERRSKKEPRTKIKIGSFRSERSSSFLSL